MTFFNENNKPQINQNYLTKYGEEVRFCNLAIGRWLAITETGHVIEKKIKDEDVIGEVPIISIEQMSKEKLLKYIRLLNIILENK